MKLAIGVESLQLELTPAPLKLALNAAISLAKGDKGDPGGAVVEGGGGFLTAQSNTGASAYPTDSAFAIPTQVAIVNVAAMDGDSIRMFGASPEIAAVAWQQGRVTNITDYSIDFYPLPGATIFVDGISAGVDGPLAIAAHSSMFWIVDSNGDLHVTT